MDKDRREEGWIGWIERSRCRPFAAKDSLEPLPTREVWMEGRIESKGAVADHPASLASRVYRAYRAYRAYLPCLPVAKEKEVKKKG